MPIISKYNCDNQKIVLKGNKREAENGMGNCPGSEEGETGIVINGYTVSVMQMKSSRDLLYNTAFIANSTIVV